jgi:hypothetical protein
MRAKRMEGAGGTPQATTSSSLERRHMGPKLGGGEFSCMLVCLLRVCHVGETDVGLTSQPTLTPAFSLHWAGGWLELFGKAQDRYSCSDDVRGGQSVFLGLESKNN